MSLTSYMSLTAWTSTADPYNHTELAANFNKLDGHRHIAGEGRQIPTSGIEDHAITTVKLAAGSVDTGSIQDGAVTSVKINAAVFGAQVPLGVVFAWWAPSSGATAVYGNRASGKLFELCDGRTITASEHDLPGGGSITLPNLIGQYIYFGALAAVGAIVGNVGHQVSLGHSHTVNAHTHVVDAHSHVVNAHSHVTSNHTHAIASGGSHKHLWPGGVDTAQRPYETSGGASRRQGLYVPNFNEQGTSETASMQSAGAHDHGGATGSMIGGSATSAETPSTTAATPGTSAASPATNSALGATDIRPRSVTLVPIIRVRNP